MSTLPTTELEVLTLVRAKLADPKAWIKGHFAGSTANPASILEPNDPIVDCWCLRGAVLAVCDLSGEPLDFSHLACKTDELLCDLLTGHGSVEQFNDNKYVSHDDVLALLDKAIARCLTK